MPHKQKAKGKSKVKSKDKHSKSNKQQQQQAEKTIKSIVVEHDFLLWLDTLKILIPFIVILCFSPKWLFYENTFNSTQGVFEAVLYGTILCTIFFTFRFIEHFIILDIPSIILDIPHIHCRNNLRITVYMVVTGPHLLATINSGINLNDYYYNTKQIDPLSAHDAFEMIGEVFIMCIVADLFCLFFALYHKLRYKYQTNTIHISNKLTNIMDCLWTHCNSYQCQGVLYMMMYIIYLYCVTPSIFDELVQFVLPVISIVFGLSFKAYVKIIGLTIVATIIDNKQDFGEMMNWYHVNEQDVIWLNWQSSNESKNK